MNSFLGLLLSSISNYSGFTISATYCLAKISLVVLFFKELLKHSRQSNSSSPIYSLGLLH